MTSHGITRHVMTWYKTAWCTKAMPCRAMFRSQCYMTSTIWYDMICHDTGKILYSIMRSIYTSDMIWQGMLRRETTRHTTVQFDLPYCKTHAMQQSKYFNALVNTVWWTCSNPRQGTFSFAYSEIFGNLRSFCFAFLCFWDWQASVFGKG